MNAGEEKISREKPLRTRSVALICPIPRSCTLPRLGDERGVIADLAPVAGRDLGPNARRRRHRATTRKAKARGRYAFGTKTVLTMSVIFSWFGL